ncbi:MAG TPA: hypothetical protein VJ728_11995 [Candidatus Binataceae bacterium]|nr:hypothetical protein [Candidatus Binataceae bacterium]
MEPAFTAPKPKVETLSTSARERWNRIKRFLTRAINWVRAEVRATRPIFLFFLTGFLLVLLIVKLTLAQYSISVNALSRALLGAVLAAKTVLILENTPLPSAFRTLPRLFDIALKSVFYGSGVLVLGFLERLFEALRHAPTMGIGLHTAMVSLNINRLLAVALGVTIVFGMYFTFAEIDEFMGGNALRGFLLRRRTP